MNMGFGLYKFALEILFQCSQFMNNTNYSCNMTKKQFAQAKVTVRKQIALPRKVQDKLDGVEIGDYILFFEDNGRIYIKKGAVKPI